MNCSHWPDRPVPCPQCVLQMPAEEQEKILQSAAAKAENCGLYCCEVAYQRAYRDWKRIVDDAPKVKCERCSNDADFTVLLTDLLGETVLAAMNVCGSCVEDFGFNSANANKEK